MGYTAFNAGGTSSITGATVTLPTVANHIAVFTNTTGNLGEDAATAINNGNIQAGTNGTQGNFVLYPAASSNGTFVITTQGNPGNYTATLQTDYSMARNTTYLLPECGNGLTNVLVGDNAGTQLVNTGSLSIENGNFLTPRGNIQVGSNGHAGSFISYPSTSSTGTLALQASSNSGNYNNIITNASTGQATTFTIQNPGGASSYLMASKSGASFTSGHLLMSGTSSGLVDQYPYTIFFTTSDFQGGPQQIFTVTVIGSVPNYPTRFPDMLMVTVNKVRDSQFGTDLAVPLVSAQAVGLDQIKLTWAANTVGYFSISVLSYNHP